MEVDQALERLQTFSPRELLRKNSDRFYQELVSTVAELCGTEMNSLYTVAEDRKRLVLQAATGLPEQWLDRVYDVPIGESDRSGVCGRAAASKKIVIASHPNDPIVGFFQDAFREAGLAAMWSLPLIDGDGQVLGTFATYYAEPRTPTERELTRVQRLAREAVRVIEMARLYYDQQSALQINERAQHLAQQLVLRTSPEKVFSDIVDGLRQLVDVDIVWLQYMSATGNVQFHQSEDLFRSPPLQWSQSPCRRALKRGLAVQESDVDLSSVVPMRTSCRFSTVMCHPLELDDGQIVVSLAWRRPHVVGSHERLVVDLYAKFGGIAMQNAARYDDLRSSYLGMIRGLLMALEVRDFETVAHSRRVATYALLLAERMGVDARMFDQIALGAALHDVGKIGISDAILRKPGKLTNAELELVKQHPVIGHRMLLHSLSQFPIALELIRHHHERYDGAGYPEGLAGEKIPLAARIAAVADAFDVMTTGRPYGRSRSVEEALAEVCACRGTQFCPQCTDAFLEMEPSVLEAVRRGELDRSPFAGPFLSDPPGAPDLPSA